MSGEIKQYFGIVGDPVQHSLSPAMHNAAFRALGLDCEYRRHVVSASELASFISGMQEQGIRGLSVTIPHKVPALQLVDRLDTAAHQIGALNTILLEADGSLAGFNTDWLGVQKAAAELIDIRRKRVLILGAGGTARAAVYAFKAAGSARVQILNRTGSKALALAEAFSVEARNWAEMKEVVAEADIIFNATSVGLESDRSPIPATYLHSGQVVLDAVYTPSRTRLLIEAEEQGCVIGLGYRMLLWQGVEQFRLFTGQDAPVGVMESVLLENLKGNPHV